MEDVDGDTILFKLSLFGNDNFGFEYSEDGVGDVVSVPVDIQDITIKPGGFIEWAPLNNKYGNDIELFTVNAYDGSETSLDSETVYVNILPINDAPNLQILEPVVINADDSEDVQIIADDIESDPLTYSIIDGPDWASVNEETGLITIDPSQEDFIELGEGIQEDIEIRYAVTDGQQEHSSAEGNFTVSVEGLNDAPSILINNSIVGIEDIPITSTYFDLLNYIQISDPDLSDLGNHYFNIEGIDSGVLELSKSSSNSFEQAFIGDTIEPTDHIRWKAAENANGELIPAFQLSASDGGGLTSETITVSYDITPVDDKPEIVVGEGFVVDGSDINKITSTVVESLIWSEQLLYNEFDGDNFEWVISGPDSNSFDIDSNGFLAFTDIADYENQTEFEITVSAVDDSIQQLSDTIEIQLDVLDLPDQDLYISSTSAYVPGDESLSIDFEYFQESIEDFGFEALYFGFDFQYNPTQLELDPSSSLLENSNFDYDKIGGSLIFDTYQPSLLSADIGSLNFNIIEPELIQDFTVELEKYVEVGYDPQDSLASLVISPDPDAFNNEGFLDLSPFQNDNLNLDLGQTNLNDFDEVGSLGVPANLGLIGRTDLELNLAFDEIVLTKNDDQLILPTSTLDYHLGDGDDSVGSPKWSLYQNMQPVSSIGLLGRGADEVHVLPEEHAPEGSEWGVLDFELGIDMIKFGETLYEHRLDIIKLLQTPGIASTGFVADFVPLILPTLSETIDPNVERVIAAGSSNISSRTTYRTRHN